jgi:hypothetical protein
MCNIHYKIQLVIANIVPSSPFLVILMKGAIRCPETSVLTRATRRTIPEDAILHSHRGKNPKSYIALTGWALNLRRNVSPVRYGLSFYIPENVILHSNCREIFKFCNINCYNSIPHPIQNKLRGP